MLDSIIFTGTSSGEPSKNRACSSFVIKSENTIYQFDAGEGFAGSSRRLNIDCHKIADIIISHMHSDHIVGLFMELQYMYLTKRENPLNIYLPEEAIDGMNKAVDMFYLLPEKFPFKFDFIPIVGGEFFKSADLSVTAYPNNHLSHNMELIEKHGKHNKCQSNSFSLATSKSSIFYTGDIKSPEELRGKIDNVDYLIADGKHISIDDLIKLCRNSNVKKLILSHLADDDLDNESVFFDISSKYDYDGLIIARDGLNIEI